MSKIVSYIYYLSPKRVSGHLNRRFFSTRSRTFCSNFLSCASKQLLRSVRDTNENDVANWEREHTRKKSKASEEQFKLSLSVYCLFLIKQWNFIIKENTNLNITNLCEIKVKFVQFKAENACIKVKSCSLFISE